MNPFVVSQSNHERIQGTTCSFLTTETLNRHGTHSSRASSLPQNQAMVGASLLATVLVQTFPSTEQTLPLAQMERVLIGVCAMLVAGVLPAKRCYFSINCFNTTAWFCVSSLAE